MERMTALMDKMYIKLEQKDMPYKPRYITEVEDIIRNSLAEEMTGEVLGLSVEIAMKVIEDMDMVEVIFQTGNF